MTEKRNHRIVGIGELVWDLLPGGRQLGGAPANFAYNVHCLGDEGLPATAVGRDELGSEALASLRRLGLSTRFVQTADFPTSTAQVEVDAEGRPDFTLKEGIAWDHLDWSPQWQELARSADAVCFGALAQRSRHSRETIQAFLKATSEHTLKLFDATLRQDFYSATLVSQCLQLCDIAKMSDEELTLIAQMLDLQHSTQIEQARELLEAYSLRLVCLTRGAQGCLLMSAEGSAEHPGFRVSVADTVGAGDAFAAALVYFYLQGAPLDRIAEAGDRLGSWVASQPGATPPGTREVARQLVADLGRE